MEPIKQKHEGLTYADLWTLSGVVAVEAMGGPIIDWSPGRVDKPMLDRVDSKLDVDAHPGSKLSVPPIGRLPMASGNSGHVRSVFKRMGFNDRETVALIGAHCVGHCHRDRSGYEGGKFLESDMQAWTKTPTAFSNSYFQALTTRSYEITTKDGILQYMDKNQEVLMLTTDMALIRDPEYKLIVEEYAQDQLRWQRDFQGAFAKLLSLGIVDSE